MSHIRYEFRCFSFSWNGHFVVPMSGAFNIHKLIVFCISLLCTAHLQAQEIELQSVQMVSDLNSRYSNENTFDSTYFDLPSVQFSEYSTHIRIGLTGCIIDLHGSHEKEATGTVIYHTDQYAANRNGWPHPKHEKTKKLYYTVPIDSITSWELITHFLQKPIDTFPEQEELLLIDSIYRMFGGIQLQLKDYKGYKQEFYHRQCSKEMNDRTASLYMYCTPLIGKLDLEYGRYSLEGRLPRGRTYS